MLQAGRHFQKRVASFPLHETFENGINAKSQRRRGAQLAKLVVGTFPQPVQRFEDADDFQLQRLMQPPFSLSASDGGEGRGEVNLLSPRR